MRGKSLELAICRQEAMPWGAGVGEAVRGLSYLSKKNPSFKTISDFSTVHRTADELAICWPMQASPLTDL